MKSKYLCRRKGCYNKQENGRCRFDDFVPDDENTCSKYYPIDGFSNNNKLHISTRPYKAGEAMAEAIIEMVNLMYQNRTAEKFLIGLNSSIAEELNIRVTKK